MPAFYHANALGAELSYIKDNAATIHLLDTYTLGQNFATVSGNSIGNAAISDTDFTGPTPSGEDMTMSFDGVSGNATSDSSTGALHIAILSGSEVLAVTDETSDQAITNGNPLSFPAFNMIAEQPTLVP